MATKQDTPVTTLEEATELVQASIKGDLRPLKDAEPDRLARIEKLMSEIDIQNSNSIIFFGSRAQEQLTAISDQMLEGVRNKDVGPAGGALNEMVVTLRGFDVDGLKERGWFSRLFGGTKPVVKFLQRFEEVRDQIDAISNKLDNHKTELLVDIASLDRLYEANLEYFHTLADYIAAGEEKLRELDETVIPALQKEADESKDVLKAQKLRDIRAMRDDLERRTHDLKLTRQVTMQSLPSIRLVQENDKSLVNKINSTMVNTIPLWRTQLAQGITIHRSREAGQTLRDATDLTNELLTANAENLKTANAEVRKEIERGVFDIETVKQANQMLIDTIEESLQIADEGKRQRIAAEAELVTCEAELRKTLASAQASARGERKPAP